jgi:flagellin-specific chaperone FliS
MKVYQAPSSGHLNSMDITAEELVAAHYAYIKAQDEVLSVETLYPIEGVPYETVLYEAALTRLKDARERMTSLMKLAKPEVINKARGIVRNTRSSP